MAYRHMPPIEILSSALDMKSLGEAARGLRLAMIICYASEIRRRAHRRRDGQTFIAHFGASFIDTGRFRRDAFILIASVAAMKRPLTSHLLRRRWQARRRHRDGARRIIAGLLLAG